MLTGKTKNVYEGVLSIFIGLFKSNYFWNIHNMVPSQQNAPKEYVPPGGWQQHKIMKVPVHTVLTITINNTDSSVFKDFPSDPAPIRGGQPYKIVSTGTGVRVTRVHVATHDMYHVHMYHILVLYHVSHTITYSCTAGCMYVTCVRVVCSINI